jgi:predicted nucleic-acid-binding protein
MLTKRFLGIPRPNKPQTRKIPNKPFAVLSKRNMHAIDTNVLVRLLVRDDAKQAKIADTFIAKGAWVSHLVLVETVWVLDAVYQRSPDQLAAALELLLSHESLVLQDADVVTAALTHFTAKLALGFSDCMVLEIARKAGHTPLGSFYKSLAKVSGVHKL